MKKAIFLLLFFIITLPACAGLKTTGKSMAEDLGSPEKTALLRERANDFWNAYVKKDYNKVYSLYDPFFRANNPDMSALIGTMIGRINYSQFEVKDIHVEGNVAKVTVSIVYSLSPIAVKRRVFSVSETPAEFQETWLYIYDNWYKEYYSEVMEKGYTDF